MRAAASIDLPDLAATRALGQRLARVLQAGDVVALAGPLGGGKTELARAIIRARAGAPIEVPSPTFTLVQDYDLPGLTIRHADLFRIDRPADVDELGVDELEGVALLVEWPERAGDRLAVDRLEIRLEAQEAGEGRRAVVEGGPRWQDRLVALLDD